MNKYFEHLSDAEREALVLENTLDLQISNLSNSLVQVTESTVLNLKAAETKVLIESGTVEDLEILYEAANEEADEKKKGIIRKIFEAIGKFFKNIKDKIKSIFTKEKAESLKEAEQVKDQPVLDTINGKLSTFMNEAKAKFTKLIHGGDLSDEEIEELNGKAKKIGVVAAGTVAITAAGKVVYDKVIKASKETDNAEGILDSMKSMFESAKGKFDEVKAKGILASVSEAVKNAGTKTYMAVANSTPVAKAKADKETKEKVKKNESTYSTSANAEAIGESTESFTDFLEGLDYTAESVDDNGVEKGSMEDLVECLNIF